jgi:D-alanine-D-alanine ligase
MSDLRTRMSRRVTVVMGGPSPEHDVSLQSGHGVAEALARRGWTVDSVTIPRDGTTAAAREYARAALAQAHPSVVFLATHGTFGEDGTLQTLCESLHLPYTGSDARASQIGMDKALSRRRFEAAELAVPRWKQVDCARGVPETVPLDDWTYPLVVKPSSQGSSVGVTIVERPAHLPSALAEAARYDETILVEEYVRGREVTVGVLGEQPLPVIEICPSRLFFDYTAKYTQGMTQYRVPAVLDPAVAQAVQAAAVVAHRAVGCRHLSRTDFILRSDGQPVVLEVNTIPGFTPTSLVPKAAACIGISYDDLCERLVTMAWQESAGAIRPAQPQVR